MEIGPVDVHSDDAFARWFGPVEAAERDDWPAEPGWSAAELAAIYRTTSDTVTRTAMATSDGAVLGSVSVELFQRDHRHLAEVHLVVHPDRRRRGVGTALLAHAETLARDDGRTTVIGTSEAPAGSAKAETRERFARRMGYQPGNVEIRRSLRLPRPPADLDRLDASCDGYAPYRIVTWTGPCPDQWLPGRIEVARAMSTDAPQGELAVGLQQWDAARIRRSEQVTEAMDRDALSAAAIDGEGNLVAFTQLALPRAEPSTAYQLDTLVLPAHRGRRLGMRLKIANLRALAARSPGTDHVLTWNAESNDPMIRVNDALGFEPVAVATDWQNVLS